MNSNNKVVFGLIIALLVISTVCAGYGIYLSTTDITKPKEPENITRAPKFNGKLYFYDNLLLLGTYKCNSEDCQFANTIIDDDEYNLNYYKEDVGTSLSVINNKYAFIKDNGDDILLYNIDSSEVVDTYKAVKNYGIGLYNNYYIVENKDELWGVIKVDNTKEDIIDFKYDFIGVHNVLVNLDESNDNTNTQENEQTNTNQTLDSSLFIVKEKDSWKIIDDTGKEKSIGFRTQIYDYNDKYVITLIGSDYYINNMSGVPILTYSLTSIKFVGDYIGVVDIDSKYYLVDPVSKKEISNKYTVSNTDEINPRFNNNKIELIINGMIVEYVNITSSNNQDSDKNITNDSNTSDNNNVENNVSNNTDNNVENNTLNNSNNQTINQEVNQ
ncbi:MAG: hypothetical protein IJ572_03380 [Bacilli bacterium]|nr:hypothetical protein [Bacilli bacterium]